MAGRQRKPLLHTIYFAIDSDLDLGGAGGHVHRETISTRPPNPYLSWVVRVGKDLHRAILGPIPSPAMHFAQRSEPFSVFQTQLCTVAKIIPRWTFQSHSQTRFPSNVSKEASLGRILCDDEIHSAVPIEVGEGRATLFPIDEYAAFRTGHSAQSAVSIAF